MGMVFQNMVMKYRMLFLQSSCDYLIKIEDHRYLNDPFEVRRNALGFKISLYLLLGTLFGVSGFRLLQNV